MSDPHHPGKVAAADEPEGPAIPPAPAAPRHESLEAVFFAAVPPRPAPAWKRAVWWLLPRVLSLAPVRALILKRYPDA